MDYNQKQIDYINGEFFRSFKTEDLDQAGFYFNEAYGSLYKLEEENTYRHIASFSQEMHAKRFLIAEYQDGDDEDEYFARYHDHHLSDLADPENYHQTLRYQLERLRASDDVALDDGAQDWHANALLESLDYTDDDVDEWLDQEVGLWQDENGRITSICRLKEDGFMGNPIFCLKYGKWADDAYEFTESEKTCNQ